jgi:hypothetical protein
MSSTFDRLQPGPVDRVPPALRTTLGAITSTIALARARIRLRIRTMANADSSGHGAITIRGPRSPPEQLGSGR